MRVAIGRVVVMTSRATALAALVVGAFGAFGCARKPAVSAEGLSLRRVVIYRNGVGYFERAGHIQSDKVFFKVKGSEVGDFLATLAVIEKGGSSVRSASFPIKPLGQQPDEPGDLEPLADDPPEDELAPGRPRPVRPPPPKKKDPNKLETVVLELDGKAHDLEVGYIAETPVWRPSYRLVIGKGASDLQAWGIVQNLSGEDWKGVRLSLIAGAPLAFEATLGTPVIPTRPTVTDMGEVIAAVPRSETSLSQEPAPRAEPPPPPPSPASAPGGAAGEESDSDVRDSEKSRKPEAKKDVAGKKGAAPKSPAPARPRSLAMSERPAAEAAAQSAVARPNPSAPRNLSALAAVATEAGATRYDIPTPVTIPDKSATMVMLLSKRVPGESIFLFAPDGGVGDSQAHPFRVARFTNQSGGLLERGPIAIFEEGAFLGQGMVDPLPDGATTTVPFALERSLAVETQRTYAEEGARIAKIESGVLVVERDSVSRTRYRVKNGGDKSAKLLVKHPRNTQARLFNPPKGTEDNVGTASALVPVETAPRATTDLTVDERQSLERTVDWLAAEADDAVRLYMADKRADPAIVAALRAAWDVRITLVRAVEERKKLTDEQGELSRATDETRRNLKALEKNRTAGDLRAKLTERLAKNSLRLEEITKKLVEVEMRVNEQRVRFSDMIRSIKLLNPPKAE